MGHRNRLARTLLDESWAYGYTLTIWGAGAFLIAAFGVPSYFDVLAYITGSLAGFAALTAYSFGGLHVPVTKEPRQVETAVEMVHLAATLGNLLLVLAAIAAEDALGVPVVLSFALTGFQATVGYSVLLLVEEYAGEKYLVAEAG